MKAHWLAALAALCASCSSARADLADEERGLVITTTAAFVIRVECDTKMIDGAATKLIDKTGVADGDRLLAATKAAVMARADMSYDRAALIPEVTRQVGAVMVSIYSDLKKDKAATCHKWTETLRKLGFAAE